MDEQQAMNMRANKLTDDSLAATHRMKNMMEEATDAGVNTLVMLDEQGEQLARIEDGMDQINNDMRDAEKQLHNLEKCCGCCVCPCKRVKNPESGSKYKKTWNKSSDVVTSQPQSHENGTRNNGYVENKTHMVKRVYNDEREDQMDDNLQQVSGLVSNLKNMALDMGSELDKQNAQISRITDKAEMNQGRIQGANKRAENILSNKWRCSPYLNSVWIIKIPSLILANFGSFKPKILQKIFPKKNQKLWQKFAVSDNLTFLTFMY